MRAWIDIETDNLSPFYTRIWCVSVCLDASGECQTYTDREGFLKASQAWTEIGGHGILSFDLFALWILWGIPFSVGPDTFNGKPVKLIDSLVMSRYLHPDRGLHGLDEWGQRLGLPKLEHKDFTCYSDEMRVYCERDAALSRAVYHHLLREEMG